MDPPETDKSTKSSNLSFVVPSSFLQRSASSDTDSFDAGFRFALAARPKGAALDSVSKFRQANVAGTKKLSSVMKLPVPNFGPPMETLSQKDACADLTSVIERTITPPLGSSIKRLPPVEQHEQSTTILPAFCHKKTTMVTDTKAQLANDEKKWADGTTQWPQQKLLETARSKQRSYFPGSQESGSTHSPLHGRSRKLNDPSTPQHTILSTPSRYVTPREVIVLEDDDVRVKREDISGRTLHASRCRKISENNSQAPFNNTPLPVPTASELAQTLAVSEFTESSERTLTRALGELSEQKATMEKCMNEAKFALKTQAEISSGLERKNDSLQRSLEISKKAVLSLTTRFSRLEKFLQGLGNDYNTLGQKMSGMNSSLQIIKNEHAEIEVLKSSCNNFKQVAEAFIRTKQPLRQAQTELKRMAEKGAFLESELSEKAGLLAEARNRIQALETQIDLDRVRHEQLMSKLNSIDIDDKTTSQLLKLERAIAERLQQEREAEKIRVNVTDNLNATFSEGVDSFRESSTKTHAWIQSGLHDVQELIKQVLESFSAARTDTVMQLTKLNESLGTVSENSLALSAEVQACTKKEIAFRNVHAAELRTQAATLTENVRLSGEREQDALHLASENLQAAERFEHKCSEYLERIQALVEQNQVLTNGKQALEMAIEASERVSSERLVNILSLREGSAKAEESLREKIAVLELETCTLIQLKENPESIAEISRLQNTIQELMKSTDELETRNKATLAVAAERERLAKAQITNAKAEISALRMELADIKHHCEEIKMNNNDTQARHTTELQRLSSMNQVLMVKVDLFEKGKAEYIALVEEQKTLERIEYEKSATLFRQKEVMRLENEIRNLKSQKKKLEAGNGRILSDDSDRKTMIEDLAMQKDDILHKYQNAQEEIERLSATLAAKEFKLCAYADNAQMMRIKLDEQRKTLLDRSRSIKSLDDALSQTQAEREVLEERALEQDLLIKTEKSQVTTLVTQMQELRQILNQAQADGWHDAAVLKQQGYTLEQYENTLEEKINCLPPTEEKAQVEMLPQEVPQEATSYSQESALKELMKTTNPLQVTVRCQGEYIASLESQVRTCDKRPNLAHNQVQRKVTTVNVLTTKDIPLAKKLPDVSSQAAITKKVVESVQMFPMLPLTLEPESSLPIVPQHDHCEGRCSPVVRSVDLSQCLVQVTASQKPTITTASDYKKHASIKKEPPRSKQASEVEPTAHTNFNVASIEKFPDKLWQDVSSPLSTPARSLDTIRIIGLPLPHAAAGSQLLSAESRLQTLADGVEPTNLTPPNLEKKRKRATGDETLQKEPIKKRLQKKKKLEDSMPTVIGIHLKTIQRLPIQQNKKTLKLAQIEALGTEEKGQNQPSEISLRRPPRTVKAKRTAKPSTLLAENSSSDEFALYDGLESQSW